MALQVSDDGVQQILTSYFNKSQPAGGNNLTLKLYCTNITPNPNGSDTTATYSGSEASGGGYSAKTLTAGSWTVSKVTGLPQAVYTQQTFTFTGQLDINTTIYGYYVVDADGVLVFAEKATSTFTPLLNGDYYSVTPKFQASSGTPTGD